MKLYHRFFIVLKIIIVMLIVLNKVYETNYSHHLEEVLEDIFAVFVGVMMVFFVHDDSTDCLHLENIPISPPRVDSSKERLLDHQGK